MKRKTWLAGMCLVLLAAAALRFAAFAKVPAGLYRDEVYNGLDALDVLEGHLPLYFAANNGREPLFIYLVTMSVGLFGRSPLALRLPAAFIGVLTVAATGAMGRALFSRRVGLLAAVTLAVTLWHTHLSRVSFRAVLLPLLIALTVWQTALAARRGRRRHFVAAGVLYGLSLYTYTAARFTVVPLVVFAVYLVIRHRRALRAPLLRGVGLAVLAAGVTLLPLAIYTIGHAAEVLGRPGQVWLWNPAIHHGHPWLTLGQHVLRTLGIVFVRGDRIWRHNLPTRPVYDPALAAAFLVGLVWAIRRARRDAAAAFTLIWIALMALPTLLAEDAPHFLRAVGMLPGLALLPALGLAWLMDGLARLPLRGAAGLRLRPVVAALPLVALSFGLGSTVHAYFGAYAHNPMSRYWFEQGVTALAGRINSAAGVGWDGQRMLRSGSGATRVFLEAELWDEWPQLRFLTPQTEALTLGLPAGQVSLPVAVFVWPYDDWSQVWDWVPVGEITIEEGPLSQGDRDPEPYTTYLALFVQPPAETSAPIARFDEGIELLEVQMTPEPDGRWRVRLRWQAATTPLGDYTVFVHYVRDGERIVQADAQPAGGRYPTTRWRAGDVVNDDHWVSGIGEVMPGHDHLVVGLWEPDSGRVLSVLGQAGNPAADWVEVPVGD
ncbi:MAG: glycosyltransferase family 39 protein [Anaerolineales bacterium]|nr:glycosyltransferase family 39 protein [Anaerolineales bacterium]